MGCFLACFGSCCKDQKRRKRRNKILPRDQRCGSQIPLRHAISSEQDISETPIDSASRAHDKPEQELSLSTRKKVTFDSNVKTYEPVSVHESTKVLFESDKVTEKEKEESFAKSNQSLSISESDSATSSNGSFPLNHRYQECGDSDDEVEELEGRGADDDENEDYDFDDEDEDEDDDGRLVDEEVWTESILTDSMEPMIVNLESPMAMPEREVRTIGLNQNARDRSFYVHPLLNPVENLTQWKVLKSKGTPRCKLDKENCTADHAATIHVSFSTEPSFKQSSRGLKSNSEHSNLNQEVAVDASLSNWLVSSETTPTKKISSVELGTVTPEKSMSQGSNSVRSFEDRPILGALTVEELRQFSASSSSPRRSPSPSPDEMPIIGTVGTYWGHNTDPTKGSGSTSSYRGIPNTTSKYREDKSVNLQYTPFEMRLERALNRGVAEV